MNREKILAELAKFEAKNTKKTFDSETNKSIFWNAKPGENKVRILPNPFAPELVAVNRSFYYLNEKTYLAPCQNGNPDPCVEVYNNFMPKDSAGAQIKLPLDEWKTLTNARNKFQPTYRYFFVVLPRGEEAEGPKWWGCSEKVWKDIMFEIFGNEDWDDITDLKVGYDVTITYTKSTKKGEFASTKVVPSPKSKPACDDLETLQTQLKDFPVIDTFFKEPTYQELKDAIEAHLKVPTTGDEPIAKAQPEQAKVQPVKTEEVKEVEDVFKSILDGIELP